MKNIRIESPTELVFLLALRMSAIRPSIGTLTSLKACWLVLRPWYGSESEDINTKQREVRFKLLIDGSSHALLAIFLVLNGRQTTTIANRFSPSPLTLTSLFQSIQSRRLGYQRKKSNIGIVLARDQIAIYRTRSKVRWRPETKNQYKDLVNTLIHAYERVHGS